MTASRMEGRGDRMLKVEKTVLPSPEQWEIIIEGMRNPKNSWDKMDSHGEMIEYDGMWLGQDPDKYTIGNNDLKLMTSLAKGGPVHAKYRRMIPVFVTINAPLYWWKEFDTYKVGTVANSCSTMHKIHDKEFTRDDFSCEHMVGHSLARLDDTIELMNYWRDLFINGDEIEPGTQIPTTRLECHSMTKKDAWWQMIQLLPSSYNQKRTIMLNYEVLAGIYPMRKNHKLDEWHDFCDWIKSLPYSEIIVGWDEALGNETDMPKEK